MKKRYRKNINFLKLIPERNVEFEEEDNGKITLILEKTKNPIIKAIINFFNRSQFFRIHLDEKGSFIWKLIDGKKNMEKIIEKIVEKFGEEDSITNRLKVFFIQLEKSKFIKYKNIDSPEVRKNGT